MISLPKGGGAIRGRGEKFAANPVTGTGSMSVPIAMSLGRSGFGPQLSLSYDSGAGNGPFGLGWNISLPYITRKTEKGLLRYQDPEEDVFILSGVEDLVPVLNQSAGWQWVLEPIPSRKVNRATSPTPSFYEHDEGTSWTPFRPFTARLNRRFTDPNLKFVDLDGDGRRCPHYGRPCLRLASLACRRLVLPGATGRQSATRNEARSWCLPMARSRSILPI